METASRTCRNGCKNLCNGDCVLYQRRSVSHFVYDTYHVGGESNCPYFEDGTKGLKDWLDMNVQAYKRSKFEDFCVYNWTDGIHVNCAHQLALKLGIEFTVIKREDSQYPYECSFVYDDIRFF